MKEYPYEQRVLSLVLEEKATLLGDALLVTGDRDLTYADAADTAARLAGGLSDLGVEIDDRVLTMLPNTVEAVVAFLGISWGGMVGVPVNSAYRGDMLRYVMADADAAALIIHADFLSVFAEIVGDLPELRRVIVVGAEAGPGQVTWDELCARPDPLPRVPRTPGDLQAIMYTSGTTGPSKGVMVPYHLAYQYANPHGCHFQEPGDVVYVTLPLFHIGGQWQGIYAAMLCDGRAVLKRKFSVSRFWDDVDRYGVTQTTLLGVMAEFLWKQPARPDDDSHSLVRATMAPALKDSAAFAQRFGLRLGQGWGLTETGCVTSPPPLDQPAQDPLCCGRVRSDLYELKLVDPDDNEVPPGVPGEAVVRAKVPFALMSGYWRKPEATVKAWRNLWLHTGDALVQNPDGTFSFVDRQKDCIRRRGENISSLEVERAVLAHDDVQECAAIPARSEHIEEEVMVVVSLRPGSALTHAELRSFLEPRMPAFMVPRYIEILEELPKTPTAKVKKDVLRAAGVRPTTWDHQANKDGALR